MKTKILLWIILGILAVNIATAFNFTNGLVSYYPFDESAGVNAVDYGGRADCIATSGTTIVNGKLGKARNFTTITDYMSCGASNTGLTTTNLTVNYWIYLTSLNTSTWSNILSKQDTIYPHQTYINSQAGGPSTITGEVQGGSVMTNSIGTGRWIMITIVNRGSSTDIYTNGTYTNTVGGGLGSLKDGILYIGSSPYNAYNPGSSSIIGIIDEIMILNRTVNSTEISELWASGSGLAFNGTGGGSTPTNTTYTLNITAKYTNGTSITTFNTTITNLNTSSSTDYSTTTGYIQLNVVNQSTYNVEFNVPYMATTHPYTQTNYGQYANITIVNVTQNWTQYIPILQYNITFSELTNVTVKQEGVITPVTNYSNTTNIIIDLNNYLQDQYIIINYGTGLKQQYLIYNNKDTNANIRLYVKTPDTLVPIQVISSGTQLDGAKVDLYIKTALNNGTLEQVFSTKTGANGYADLLISSTDTTFTAVVSKTGYTTKTVELQLTSGMSNTPTVNLAATPTETDPTTIWTNCWHYMKTAYCDVGVYSYGIHTLGITTSGSGGYTDQYNFTTSVQQLYYDTVYISSTTSPVTSCVYLDGTSLGCKTFTLLGVSNITEQTYYNGTVTNTETTAIDDTEEGLIAYTIVILLALLILLATLESYMDGLGMTIVGILGFIIGFQIYPVWIGIGMFIVLYIIYRKVRKIYTT